MSDSDRPEVFQERSNKCVVCMKPTGSIRKVYCSEHGWNSVLKKMQEDDRLIKDWGDRMPEPTP